MFFALRSSAPVQKYSAPSSQTEISGVTCGRPSGRTVEIQNTSESCNRPSASDHPLAPAPALLKRESSSPRGWPAFMGRKLRRGARERERADERSYAQCCRQHVRHERRDPQPLRSLHQDERGKRACDQAPDVAADRYAARAEREEQVEDQPEPESALHEVHPAVAHHDGDRAEEP